MLQRNLEDTTVRDEIRALGRRAEIVHLDVSDQASVRTVIDRTLQVFPTLDILVNNAGIQKRHEYVVYIPIDVWMRLLIETWWWW